MPRADRATLFSGICEGGPIHGKMLHHGTPTYEAAMVGPKIVTRSQEAKKVWKEPDLKWFTYRHEDGRWICKS